MNMTTNGHYPRHSTINPPMNTEQNMSAARQLKSTPPAGRAKYLTHDDLSARFAAIEEQLMMLKGDLVETPTAEPTEFVAPKEAVAKPETYTREENAQRLETLLELGSALTIREIADALGVGNKTAYRLANDVAFAKKGFLYFEPHKNVLRLRLVAISRVLVDAKVR